METCKKNGIDFIICDHHLPSKELPNAIGVLNPKRIDCEYPFKELCGCGIGFKLIQAFYLKWKLDFNKIIEYTDLVTIAIISDIVPIIDENRTIEETLALQWSTISNLPKNELTKVKDKFIEQYYKE